MSFKSEKIFSDFVHFPRGIRRSGRFSIKESELLEEYGTAMMEIYKGDRKPKTADEKSFLSQMKTTDVPSDPYTKVFKKYLHEIEPHKTHVTQVADDDDDVSFESNDDVE